MFNAYVIKNIVQEIYIYKSIFFHKYFACANFFKTTEMKRYFAIGGSLLGAAALVSSILFNKKSSRTQDEVFSKNLKELERTVEAYFEDRNNAEDSYFGDKKDTVETYFEDKKHVVGNFFKDKKDAVCTYFEDKKGEEWTYFEDKKDEVVINFEDKKDAVGTYFRDK